MANASTDILEVEIKPSINDVDWANAATKLKDKATAMSTEISGEISNYTGDSAIAPVFEMIKEPLNNFSSSLTRITSELDTLGKIPLSSLAAADRVNTVSKLTSLQQQLYQMNAYSQIAFRNGTGNMSYKNVSSLGTSIQSDMLNYLNKMLPDFKSIVGNGSSGDITHRLQMGRISSVYEGIMRQMETKFGEQGKSALNQYWNSVGKVLMNPRMTSEWKNLFGTPRLEDVRGVEDFLPGFVKGYQGNASLISPFKFHPAPKSQTLFNPKGIDTVLTSDNYHEISSLVMKNKRVFDAALRAGIVRRENGGVRRVYNVDSQDMNALTQELYKGYIETVRGTSDSSRLDPYHPIDAEEEKTIRNRAKGERAQSYLEALKVVEGILNKGDSAFGANYKKGIAPLERVTPAAMGDRYEIDEIDLRKLASGDSVKKRNAAKKVALQESDATRLISKYWKPLENGDSTDSIVYLNLPDYDSNSQKDQELVAKVASQNGYEINGKKYVMINQKRDGSGPRFTMIRQDAKERIEKEWAEQMVLSPTARALYERGSVLYGTGEKSKSEIEAMTPRDRSAYTFYDSIYNKRLWTSFSNTNYDGPLSSKDRIKQQDINRKIFSPSTQVAVPHSDFQIAVVSPEVVGMHNGVGYLEQTYLPTDTQARFLNGIGKGVLMATGGDTSFRFALEKAGLLDANNRFMVGDKYGNNKRNIANYDGIITYDQLKSAGLLSIIEGLTPKEADDVVSQLFQNTSINAMTRAIDEGSVKRIGTQEMGYSKPTAKMIQENVEYLKSLNSLGGNPDRILEEVFRSENGDELARRGFALKKAAQEENTKEATDAYLGWASSADVQNRVQSYIKAQRRYAAQGAFVAPKKGDLEKDTLANRMMGMSLTAATIHGLDPYRGRIKDQYAADYQDNVTYIKDKMPELFNEAMAKAKDSMLNGMYDVTSNLSKEQQKEKIIADALLMAEGYGWDSDATKINTTNGKVNAAALFANVDRSKFADFDEQMRRRSMSNVELMREFRPQMLKDAVRAMKETGLDPEIYAAAIDDSSGKTKDEQLEKLAADLFLGDNVVWDAQTRSSEVALHRSPSSFGDNAKARNAAYILRGMRHFGIAGRYDSDIWKEGVYGDLFNHDTIGTSVNIYGDTGGSDEDGDVLQVATGEFAEMINQGINQTQAIRAVASKYYSKAQLEVKKKAFEENYGFSNEQEIVKAVDRGLQSQILMGIASGMSSRMAQFGLTEDDFVSGDLEKRARINMMMKSAQAYTDATTAVKTGLGFELSPEEWAIYNSGAEYEKVASRVNEALSASKSNATEIITDPDGTKKRVIKDGYWQASNGRYINTKALKFLDIDKSNLPSVYSIGTLANMMALTPGDADPSDLEAIREYYSGGQEGSLGFKSAVGDESKKFLGMKRDLLLQFATGSMTASFVGDQLKSLESQREKAEAELDEYIRKNADKDARGNLLQTVNGVNRKAFKKQKMRDWGFNIVDNAKTFGYTPENILAMLTKPDFLNQDQRTQLSRLSLDMEQKDFAELFTQPSVASAPTANTGTSTSGPGASAKPMPKPVKRKDRFTAHQGSVLMGYSNWSTPLQVLAEKYGWSQPPVQEGSAPDLAMKAGAYLEQEIIDYYGKNMLAPGETVDDIVGVYGNARQKATTGKDRKKEEEAIIKASGRNVFEGGRTLKNTVNGDVTFPAGSQFSGRWDAVVKNAAGKISRFGEIKTISDKQWDQMFGPNRGGEMFEPGQGALWDNIIQAALYSSIAGFDSFDLIYRKVTDAEKEEINKELKDPTHKAAINATDATNTKKLHYDMNSLMIPLRDLNGEFERDAAGNVKQIAAKDLMAEITNRNISLNQLTAIPRFNGSKSGDVTRNELDAAKYLTDLLGINIDGYLPNARMNGLNQAKANTTSKMGIVSGDVKSIIEGFTQALGDESLNQEERQALGEAGKALIDKASNFNVDMRKKINYNKDESFADRFFRSSQFEIDEANAQYKIFTEDEHIKKTLASLRAQGKASGFESLLNRMEEEIANMGANRVSSAIAQTQSAVQNVVTGLNEAIKGHTGTEKQKTALDQIKNSTKNAQDWIDGLNREALSAALNMSPDQAKIMSDVATQQQKILDAMQPRISEANARIIGEGIDSLEMTIGRKTMSPDVLAGKQVDDLQRRIAAQAGLSLQTLKESGHSDLDKKNAYEQMTRLLGTRWQTMTDDELTSVVNGDADYRMLFKGEENGGLMKEAMTSYEDSLKTNRMYQQFTQGRSVNRQERSLRSTLLGKVTTPEQQASLARENAEDTMKANLMGIQDRYGSDSEEYKAAIHQYLGENAGKAEAQAFIRGTLTDDQRKTLGGDYSFLDAYQQRIYDQQSMARRQQMSQLSMLDMQEKMEDMKYSPFANTWGGKVRMETMRRKMSAIQRVQRREQLQMQLKGYNVADTNQGSIVDLDKIQGKGRLETPKATQTEIDAATARLDRIKTREDEEKEQAENIEKLKTASVNESKAQAKADELSKQRDAKENEMKEIEDKYKKDELDRYLSGTFHPRNTKKKEDFERYKALNEEKGKLENQITAANQTVQDRKRETADAMRPFTPKMSLEDAAKTLPTSAGADYTGAVFYGQDVSKLTKNQLAQIAVADGFAKAYGLQVGIHDTLTDDQGSSINGKFDPTSNKFDLALDAEGNLITGTMGHEMLHFIKQNSPEDYDNLMQFAKSQLKSMDGFDYDARVQQIYQRYNAGKDSKDWITLAEAEEEVTANAMGNLLNNRGVIDNLQRQNGSLGNMVSDRLGDYAGTFYELGKTLTPEAAAMAKLSEEKTNVAVNMFTQAAANAARRRQQAAGPRQQTRYSMREVSDPRRQLAALHATDVSSFQAMLKGGFIEIPSIAAAKAESVHSAYGDTFLQFDPDTVNPEKNPNAYIFNGNATTGGGGVNLLPAQPAYKIEDVFEKLKEYVPENKRAELFERLKNDSFELKDQPGQKYFSQRRIKDYNKEASALKYFKETNKTPPTLHRRLFDKDAPDVQEFNQWTQLNPTDITPNDFIMEREAIEGNYHVSNTPEGRAASYREAIRLNGGSPGGLRFYGVTPGDKTRANKSFAWLQERRDLFSHKGKNEQSSNLFKDLETLKKDIGFMGNDLSIMDLQNASEEKIKNLILKSVKEEKLNKMAEKTGLAKRILKFGKIDISNDENIDKILAEKGSIKSSPFWKILHAKELRNKRNAVKDFIKLNNIDTSSLEDSSYVTDEEKEKISEAQEKTMFYRNKYKNKVQEYSEIKIAENVPLKDNVRAVYTPKGTLSQEDLEKAASLGISVYQYDNKIPGETILDYLQSQEVAKYRFSRKEKEQQGPNQQQNGGLPPIVPKQTPQNDSDDEDIISEIEASDSGNAADLLNDLTDSAKNAGSSVTQIGTAFSMMGQSAVSAVSKIMTTQITKWINQAINQAIQFVQQWDAAMTQIQTITMKTDEEMEAFSQDTMQQAIDLKASSSDVATIKAGLYRQGLSDEEVNERTESIVKFSKVTGIKASEASKIVATALNTGLEESATHALDVLASLGDSAATTADQIQKGIQKAGSSAKVADVSYEELATLMTIGTANTQLSGQQIGTSLQTIFSRMNRLEESDYIADINGENVSVNDVESALKLVGVSLRDDEGNFKGSFQVLKELADVWQDLNDSQKSLVTNAMAGSRQSNVFQSLMEGMSEDGGEEMERLLGLAENSDGTTESKYEIATKSLATSLTLLQTSWEACVEAVVSSDFMTFLLNSLDSVSEFLQKIADLINNGQGLAVGLTGVGSAIAGLAACILAASGPIGWIVGIGAAVAGISFLSSAQYGANTAATLKTNKANAESRIEEVQTNTNRRETAIEKAKSLNDQYNALTTESEKQAFETKYLDDFNSAITDVCLEIPEMTGSFKDAKLGSDELAEALTNAADKANDQEVEDEKDQFTEAKADATTLAATTSSLFTAEEKIIQYMNNETGRQDGLSSLQDWSDLTTPQGKKIATLATEDDTTASAFFNVVKGIKDDNGVSLYRNVVDVYNQKHPNETVDSTSLDSFKKVMNWINATQYETMNQNVYDVLFKNLYRTTPTLMSYQGSSLYDKLKNAYELNTNETQGNLSDEEYFMKMVDYFNDGNYQYGDEILKYLFDVTGNNQYYIKDSDTANAMVTASEMLRRADYQMFGTSGQTPYYLAPANINTYEEKNPGSVTYNKQVGQYQLTTSKGTIYRWSFDKTGKIVLTRKGAGESGYSSVNNYSELPYDDETMEIFGQTGVDSNNGVANIGETVFTYLIDNFMNNIDSEKLSEANLSESELRSAAEARVKLAMEEQGYYNSSTGVWNINAKNSNLVGNAINDVLYDDFISKGVAGGVSSFLPYLSSSANLPYAIDTDELDKIFENVSINSDGYKYTNGQTGTNRLYRYKKNGDGNLVFERSEDSGKTYTAVPLFQESEYEDDLKNIQKIDTEAITERTLANNAVYQNLGANALQESVDKGWYNIDLVKEAIKRIDFSGISSEEDFWNKLDEQTFTSSNGHEYKLSDIIGSAQTTDVSGTATALYNWIANKESLTEDDFAFAANAIAGMSSTNQYNVGLVEPLLQSMISKSTSVTDAMNDSADSYLIAQIKTWLGDEEFAQWESGAISTGDVLMLLKAKQIGARNDNVSTNEKAQELIEGFAGTDTEATTAATTLREYADQLADQQFWLDLWDQGVDTDVVREALGIDTSINSVEAGIQVESLKSSLTDGRQELYTNVIDALLSGDEANALSLIKEQAVTTELIQTLINNGYSNLAQVLATAIGATFDDEGNITLADVSGDVAGNMSTVLSDKTTKAGLKLANKQQELETIKKEKEAEISSKSLSQNEANNIYDTQISELETEIADSQTSYDLLKMADEYERNNTFGDDTSSVVSYMRSMAEGTANVSSAQSSLAALKASASSFDIDNDLANATVQAIIASSEDTSGAISSVVGFMNTEAGKKYVRANDGYWANVLNETDQAINSAAIAPLLSYLEENPPASISALESDYTYGGLVQLLETYLGTENYELFKKGKLTLDEVKNLLYANTFSADVANGSNRTTVADLIAKLASGETSQYNSALEDIRSYTASEADWEYYADLFDQGVTSDAVKEALGFSKNDSDEVVANAIKNKRIEKAEERQQYYGEVFKKMKGYGLIGTSDGERTTAEVAADLRNSTEEGAADMAEFLENIDGYINENGNLIVTDVRSDQTNAETAMQDKITKAYAQRALYEEGTAEYKTADRQVKLLEAADAMSTDYVTYGDQASTISGYLQGLAETDVERATALSNISSVATEAADQQAYIDLWNKGIDTKTVRNALGISEDIDKITADAMVNAMQASLNTENKNIYEGLVNNYAGSIMSDEEKNSFFNGKLDEEKLQWLRDNGYEDLATILSGVTGSFENGNFVFEGISGDEKETGEARSDELTYWTEKLNEAKEGTDEFAKAQAMVKGLNLKQSINEMREYGDNTEYVADTLGDLTSKGKKAANTIASLTNSVIDLRNQQWALNTIQKGWNEEAGETLGLTEQQYKMLKENNLLDEYLENMQQGLNEDVAAQLFDPLTEAINQGLQDGTIDRSFVVQYNTALEDGTLDTSEIKALIANTQNSAVQDILASFGDEAVVDIRWESITGENGLTIYRIISGKQASQKKQGSGGGGGKSAADELVDKQKKNKTEYEHMVKMVQYQQTKYQNANELGNYGLMIEKEIEVEKKRLPVIEDNIKALKEQIAQTKAESDDWYTLRDAILEAEEEYEEINNTIEENIKKLEENQQAIYKLRTDLEDTVKEEIENRKSEEEDMLSGSVSMQETILSAIKQRYQDEWDLVKKDIEKKKQALEEEKNLIDERLQKRKDAADEQEKYEELAEYKKQLALISMDSTRTKDAAELREKIADLEEEIGWDIAEAEAEQQTNALQDEIDAYDDYVTEGDEKLEDYLNDANNFADEVNNVLKMTQEEMFNWMKANVQDYVLSLNDAQLQMVKGWEDTYKQMYGIVDTYWSEINGVLTSKDTFLNYMKNSSDYINASEESRAQMLYNWEEAYDNWAAAQKKDADYAHSDDYGEGSYSLPYNTPHYDWNETLNEVATSAVQGYNATANAQLQALKGTTLQSGVTLTQTQTKQLKALLNASSYVQTPNFSTVDTAGYGNNNSINIDEIQIVVNEASFADEDDYDAFALKVGDAFVKQLSKRGITTANYSF